MIKFKSNGSAGWLLEHWRLCTGVTLFISAELLLFGASEGAQKWQWIEFGSIPNLLLTAGYIFHNN